MVHGGRGDLRVLRKEEAQARLLGLVAQGSSVRAGLRAVGRSLRAYENWRRNEPEFARKVDLVRARRKLDGGGTGGVNGRRSGLDFMAGRLLYFDHESPDHHVEMVGALASQEPDSISLVLAPPESAKTSLLVDWINWQLGAVDPNYRIMVASEGRDLSRKILGQVQMRMLDDRQFAGYIDAFGPFKAPSRDDQKRWNADYMTVLQASHDEKEPSLEARGAGSRIYGGRYDKIHNDDIQSLETLNKTKALLDYIRQTQVSRMHKGVGSISMWGSRVGPGDIYAALLDEGLVDHLVRIPALTRPLRRDEHFLETGKGKVVLAPGCPEVSYWPEYWSMLDLAKKRQKVGERVWAQTYMQQPVSSEGAAFPLVLVQGCLDRGRLVGRLGDGVGVFCSLDPALTGNAAFAVWAYDMEHLWLVDIEAYSLLGNNENIFRKLRELTAKYRPSAWVIETDGQGNKGIFADERLREIADAFHFDLVPHVTTGSKQSHAFGVAAMASSFSRQELVLPFGDETSRRHVQPLVDELVAWRSDVPTRLLVQDRVIATWIAWRHWLNLRNAMSADNEPLWTPSWLKQRAGTGGYL